MRFSHVDDAALVYNVVKKEHDDLSIDYIASSDFAKVSRQPFECSLTFWKDPNADNHLDC